MQELDRLDLKNILAEHPYVMDSLKDDDFHTFTEQFCQLPLGSVAKCDKKRLCCQLAIDLFPERLTDAFEDRNTISIGDSLFACDFPPCIAISGVNVIADRSFSKIYTSPYFPRPVMPMVMTLPDAYYVGRLAFYANSPREVHLPKVEYIYNGAFKCAEQLEILDVGEEHGLQIEQAAFTRCDGLKSVDFSRLSNLWLRAEAFAYCSNLEEVILPKKCMYFEEGIFVGCPKVHIKAPKRLRTNKKWRQGLREDQIEWF